VRHLIIAFSDQPVAAKLRQILAGHGLPVIATCASGAQVLQQTNLLDGGGVVICPYRLVDMSAREIAHLMPDTYDMLVLVTPRQQGLIIDPGIYTLTQPLNAIMLVDGARQLLETRQIRVTGPAMSGRPRPERPFEAETPAHGRTPEEQKIIEQAKYLLMNRRKLSEQDAHRYLQRKSMETGLRITELARRLIEPG
jgi:response regulator NasT